LYGRLSARAGRRLCKTVRFELADVEWFLNLPIEAGELVFPDSRGPAPISDPDDVAVLHAAVAGGAEVICTLDGHFFQPEVIAWRRRLGIRVESDVDLLRRLPGR
jgi:predicted nucleic acid-binding protein